MNKKLLVYIILCSQIFAQPIESSIEEIERLINSNSIKETQKGSTLRSKLSQRERDILNFKLLDSKRQSYSFRGIQVQSPREASMYMLQRRFPEMRPVLLSERRKTLEVWPTGDEYARWSEAERKRDIENMKLWWKVNKDKIEYKEDGSYIWTSEPVHMSALDSNEVTPLSEEFLEQMRPKMEVKAAIQKLIDNGEAKIVNPNNSLGKSKLSLDRQPKEIEYHDASKSDVRVMWITISALILLSFGYLVFWIRKKTV